MDEFLADLRRLVSQGEHLSQEYRLYLAEIVTERPDLDDLISWSTASLENYRSGPHRQAVELARVRIVIRLAEKLRSERTLATRFANNPNFARF